MRLIACALSALFLAAAPAAAQSVSPTNPPAAAPLPVEDSREARIELATRYMRAVDINRVMRRMMEAIMPLVTQQSASEVSRDERAAVETIVLDAMDAVMPEAELLFAAHFADTYSFTELKALVEFYESPVGRSINQKTQAAEAKMGVMGEAFGELLAEEVRRQLCDRFGCDEKKRAA